MNSRRGSHGSRDRKYGSKHSLILDSRLIIETRGIIKDADVGLKTSWSDFKMQSSPHSHLRRRACHIRHQISQRADLKFSKSRTQTWASHTKLFQVSKCGVHRTRVWRTWDLDFEDNKHAFHQVTWKARLQSMDAWISKKEISWRDQETKSLYGWWW